MIVGNEIMVPKNGGDTRPVGLDSRSVGSNGMVERLLQGPDLATEARSRSLSASYLEMVSRMSVTAHRESV